MTLISINETLCIISKVVDRPKLIQEYAEKYRTYKQSIFIDYSELKK